MTVASERPGASPSQPARSAPGMMPLGDILFKLACRTSAASILVLAVFLVIFLFYESLPALQTFGLRFLINTNWDPTVGRLDLGALPFIYGTLVTSAIAMAIGAPLGIGTAVYLAEIAPAGVRRVAAFLVELLAAIPSVVYGFWGKFFIVFLAQQLFQWLFRINISGNGIFWAGLILAIMIVPYITSITYDVCQAVPRSQREGALALGATRWQMIWSAVLPYAQPGIVGACFLGLGRALGETMAVVMLIGNDPKINLNPFAEGATIPSVIANELQESPSEVKRSALVLLALILLLVTIVVNCLARLMIWRLGGTSRRMAVFNLGQLLGQRWAGRLSESTLDLPLPIPDGMPIPADAQPPSSAPAAPARLPMPPSTRAKLVDRLMTGVLATALLLTLGPLFLILGYITYRGVTSINLAFFTNRPLDDPPGLGPAIYGSFLMVLLATVCAVPVGILAAIFLAEYRTSRLAPVVRFVTELLAGVPSIVIGIFIYAVAVAPFNDYRSGWAGAFALGVMMIPVVVRASEKALKLVPQSLRHASYALGAAYWQTVVRVTVPAALPAIITAIFLAIARIAGETAPLLLTAGSSDYLKATPNTPMPYLTYFIYFYSRGGMEKQENLAWAAAFVLLAFVMLLNIGIRLLTGKRVVLASRAD